MERGCGVRGKFKWTHLDKHKSELMVPKRCTDCEEEQRNYCIERSWESQGRSAKELKAVNVMLNINPNADAIATRIEAKNQEKLEDLLEKED